MKYEKDLHNRQNQFQRSSSETVWECTIIHSFLRIQIQVIDGHKLVTNWQLRLARWPNDTCHHLITRLFNVQCSSFNVQRWIFDFNVHYLMLNSSSIVARSHGAMQWCSSMLNLWPCCRLATMPCLPLLPSQCKDAAALLSGTYLLLSWTKVNQTKSLPSQYKDAAAQR